MRQFQVTITDRSDALTVCDNLRSELITNGLSAQVAETLYQKVRPIADKLDERGRELASLGTAFEVKKLIQDCDCEICIHAIFGKRPFSLINRLVNLFKS